MDMDMVDMDMVDKDIENMDMVDIPISHIQVGTFLAQFGLVYCLSPSPRLSSWLLRFDNLKPAASTSACGTQEHSESKTLDIIG